MKLFITCQEASRIISDGMEHRLPVWDRVIVRLHLWRCRTCGYYRRQILGIRELLSRCQDSDVLSCGPGLPSPARERIKSALKKQNL